MHSLSRRRLAGLVLLTASAGAEAKRSAADDVPLAIHGYDPVAYFSDGKPTRGRPEFAYDWDGYRYRFSSAAHRDLFRANPVRYAPQFANFCAMALSRGEVLEANPAYWLISDGKLYLFGKPGGPERFRRGLAGHIAQATRNEERMISR
jgi:YHS domain-containing protein